MRPIPRIPLPRSIVESFTSAYYEAYGIELPDDEAQRLASYLLDSTSMALEIRAKQIVAKRFSEPTDDRSTTASNPR